MNKCFWRYDRGHSVWVTSCGASFDADDFGCNETTYCPSCKRKTTTERTKSEEFVGDSDHEKDDRIL